MPPLRTDVERLHCRKGSNTKEHSGTRSQGAYTNTTTVLKERQSWDDASYVQPQPAERNGRESHGPSRPDEVHNDGVSQLRAAKQARYTSTPEQEVSDIAIQTESCDTIYVTKDTLVAYTIAVVQNTQTLQFEQMQVALQTAQNQASIETPLRAEHLMTTHFNLAILTDSTASNKAVNAPTTETGVTKPGPSNFVWEEEMICKSPHTNSCTTNGDKPTQLTGAVFPTYRGEPGPVRGIPVGYKSDNSWDFSDADQPDCSHQPSITPLVAYTSWRGRLNRGRGQNYRLGNNIAVRGSNVPHPRQWQNQRMATEPEVSKHSRHMPTKSGSAIMRYRRLLHKRSASLDLETAFKCINISHEIKPNMCQTCNNDKCQCPAFTPEMPCSYASSMPTKHSTDDEDIPELVDNRPLQVLYPPVQSPSDEEANWEVAAICSAPVYHWVKSWHTRRHQYYTYDSLDFIEEDIRGKRRHYTSSHVQGHPVEH